MRKHFFFLLYLGWMNNERLIDQQAWHNFRIFFSYSCSLQKQRQMKIESPVRENSHGGVWPGRKLRVIELRESFRSQENTASRIRSYSKIVDKINVFFFYFSTMFFESVKWEFLVEKRLSGKKKYSTLFCSKGFFFELHKENCSALKEMFFF